MALAIDRIVLPGGGGGGWASPVQSTVTGCTYWFPTVAGTTTPPWSIVEFDPATEAITLIATGIAFGWAGACEAPDGSIVATPMAGHRNVLRLDPSTHAVTSVTYTGTDRSSRDLGLPVAAAGKVFAWLSAGTAAFSDFLRVTFSPFAASTVSGYTGATGRRYSGSLLHPNGSIYLTPGNQGSGWTVGRFDPAAEIMTNASVPGSGTRYLGPPAIGADGAIYAGRGSGQNAFYRIATSGTFAVTMLTWAGTSAVYGARHSLLLMPGGDIFGLATSPAQSVSVTPSAATTGPTPSFAANGGGVVAEDGNAYFVMGVSGEVEQVSPGLTLTTIPRLYPGPGNASGEPSYSLGKVFGLANNPSAGYVWLIRDVGPPDPATAVGWVRGHAWG